MPSLKISLVTRTHNAFALTDEFLSSWDEQINDFHEIIVVDDGSSPQQSLILQKKWGRHVNIIKTPGYIEYCKALNIGLKTAAENGADLAFCVNNDTKSFSLNFAKIASQQFDLDPNLALLGPHVTDYDGTVLSDGSDKLKFGMIMNVPTEGYVLNLRKFKKIGLFDERLIRYFEDLDIIQKFRSSGYHVYSTDRLSFSHLCNGSSSKQPWIPSYYRARNTQWFVQKYCKDRPIAWQLRKRLNAIPFSYRRFKSFLSNGEYSKALIVPLAFIVGTAVGVFTKW